MNRLQKSVAAGLALVLPAVMLLGCTPASTPAPTPTFTRAPLTPTPPPTPTPDLVATYTAAGWGLLWNSDFSGAEAAFEMAREFDEGAVAPYLGLATLYYYLPGRGKEGLEAAERAVAIVPQDSEVQTAYARALLDRYQFEESLAAAERAVALGPDSSDAHAALARILLEMNRHDDALESALKAVALDSGSALAHHELASVYADMGKKNEALAEAHTAATLQPTFAPRWNSLAYSYRHYDDNPVQAREYITQALRLAPGCVAALDGLAMLEAEAGHYDLAHEACAEIKGLLPDAPNGYGCQALAYFDEESYEEAIEELEAAIELDPDTPWLHMSAGWAHIMLDDCDEAAVEYEMVAETYPWLDGGHLGLALVAMCNDEPDEALVHAEEAVALHPYSVVHRSTLALVLVALEDLDKAEAAIEEALEIDPEDPFLFSRLAFVALQQGRSRDAIEYLEHAVALDPDEGSYHTDLGSHLLFIGDYGRALEHFELAREMGEDQIIVIDGLATALLGIGDLDQARVVLDAGLDSYPDSAELHAKVGGLLMLEDRCEEAIVEYDRALRQDPVNEHALSGREVCESILNPAPAPTPAPVLGVALSHATARELAAGVVERAGGTFLDAFVDTSGGTTMWAVGYATRHAGGSAEFNAQQRQITFGLSDLVARLDPPVVALGVVALDSSGELMSAVGVATEIAKLWVAGRLSDEEFVDLWYIEAS